MKINVYDMLVFEDAAGSIYQDCVCSIQYEEVSIASNENEKDEYFYIVSCNIADLYLDNDFNAVKIIWNDASGYFNDKLSLKEIWTRTDEDTYKKVWENK